MTLSTKAVFFDRDGTINDNSSFVENPDELILYPNAAMGLRMLRKAGFLLVVVTNQGGVSLGHTNETAVRLIHERMTGVLLAEGASIDAVYTAAWHQHGDQGRGDDPSWRKPEPGMLLAAAKDLAIDLEASFMVGDRATDIEAGRRAGCRTVLVRTGDGPTQSFAPGEEPDFEAADLLDAAAIIIEASGAMRDGVTVSEPSGSVRDRVDGN